MFAEYLRDDVHMYVLEKRDYYMKTKKILVIKACKLSRPLV